MLLTEQSECVCSQYHDGPRKSTHGVKALDHQSEARFEGQVIAAAFILCSSPPLLLAHRGKSLGNRGLGYPASTIIIFGFE